MKKFSQATLVLGFCLLMVAFQSYAATNKCPRVKALQVHVPASEGPNDKQTKDGAAITLNCPGSPVIIVTTYRAVPPLKLLPDLYFPCYNEKRRRDDYSANVYSPPRIS